MQKQFFLQHPQLMLFNRYVGSAQTRELALSFVSQFQHSETESSLEKLRHLVDSMKRLAEEDGKRAVLSAEGLSSSRYQSWAAKGNILFQAVEPDLTKIVIVVRRPLALVRSVFLQMKIYEPHGGKTNSLSRWLEVQLDQLRVETDGNTKHPFDNLHYYDLWRFYCDRFGSENVVIQALENLARAPQQFGTDLCLKLGLEAASFDLETRLNTTSDKQIPEGLDMTLDPGVSRRLLDYLEPQIAGLEESTDLTLQALGYLRGL